MINIVIKNGDFSNGSVQHERAQAVHGIGAESVWMRPHGEAGQDRAQDQLPPKQDDVRRWVVQ